MENKQLLALNRKFGKHGGRSMPETNDSLKDMLFNEETVELLGKKIQGVYSEFETEKFIHESINGFGPLELKERMNHMTLLLYKYLPKDYKKATHILLKSLESLEETMFVFGAYCEYVAAYGCTQEDLIYSLELLGEFTKYFSAEFAIRDFINEYPKETFSYMEKWSLSENVHQRRFASEGLRPKLPWAKGIRFDYKKAIMVLDNLYYDQERYVTRSVANHLNDISKLDPSLVIGTLEKWKNEGKQKPEELDYMIHHSLRTLIKKGHVDTLDLLGFHQNPAIVVKDMNIATPKIHIGDSLEFSFVIESLEDEDLLVDYIVTYPMANNKRSTKVFKLKKTLFKKGTSTTISKKHPFKVMTTKKLYSGLYELDIQINGQLYCHDTFEIEVD